MKMSTPSSCSQVDISFSKGFEDWTPNRFLLGADAEDQKRAPGVIRRHIDDPNMLGPLFVEPDPVTGDGVRLAVSWKSDVGITALAERVVRL